MKESMQPSVGTAFHPIVWGCVVRDVHLARELLKCYQGELYGIAAYLSRSLSSEREDAELSELFDGLARGQIEQFRLVGELIAALGGTPMLCTQVRVEPLPQMKGERSEALIACSVREEKRMIDRYQTMLGATGDRVVRSVFFMLLEEKHRRLERLREWCENS